MATSWTDANFEALSWHDNHVHGLRIEIANEDHGTGTLILDLDHILEWLPPVDGFFRFRVAPATLTFHEVFGLKVDLDWAAATAGMTPFSISQISREKVEYQTGYTRWRWAIGVNWPEGIITFEGQGFRQELRGEPVIVADPCLPANQRAQVAGA